MGMLRCSFNQGCEIRDVQGGRESWGITYSVVRLVNVDYLPLHLWKPEGRV